jgi:hypothetical protein
MMMHFKFAWSSQWYRIHASIHVVGCAVQNPNDVNVPTTSQFDHIQRDLAANDAAEAASVIRNSNATMQKVLKGLKDSKAGIVTEASSRRALAMAQLEAAIQQNRVAKGKTAAHETKSTNYPGTANCRQCHPPNISCNSSLFHTSDLSHSSDLFHASCSPASHTPFDLYSIPINCRDGHKKTT